MPVSEKDLPAVAQTRKAATGDREADGDRDGRPLRAAAQELAHAEEGENRRRDVVERARPG
jgi:hypothetical protein